MPIIPTNPGRKIIRLLSLNPGQGTIHALALCSDGAVFEIGYARQWIRLPPIPQEALDADTPQ